MTKKRQSNLPITATDSNTSHFSVMKFLSKIVAVIAKFDCRFFCHINSLEDKISNTAATIQPNPFWFWEKYHYFFIFIPVNFQ